MTSAPPDARAPRRLAPERRRRGDVVVAVALVVLLGVAALVVWGTSPEVATVSTPDTTPLGAPSPAGDVPAGFVEAWRAPSGATRAPVVAGPAVVTGDGGLVAGHDATSGAVAWSYRRDLALCTVAAGFPGADDGDGHALALYAGRTGWCSELTALHPSSGKRADTSNPDMRPGVQLARRRLVRHRDRHRLPGGVALRPRAHPRVRRRADPRAARQAAPSGSATYGSTAISSDRIGVIERCPDAPSDRLTVITPDGSKGADTPEVQFSVELPAAGAVLVALSSDRAAVAVPGPPRLIVYDKAGLQLSQAPLDVPDAALATSPAGAPASVTTDGSRVVLVGGRHHDRARRRHAHARMDAARHPRPPDRLRHRPPGPGPRRPRRSRPRAGHRAAHAAGAARRPGRRGPDRRRGRGAAGAARHRGRGVAARPLDEPLHGQHRHDRHDHARRGQSAPRGLRCDPRTPAPAPPRPPRRRAPAAWPPRGPASLPAAPPPTPRPARDQRDHARREHPGQAAQGPQPPRPVPRPPCRWFARDLAHGLSCAHGSLSGAAARPSGQCRRTSQDPQRGAGRAGSGVSGSRLRASASAAAASAAADRSAAAMCAASDSSVVPPPRDVPAGQVVQLHLDARPPQRAFGAERVQRQRAGLAGVLARSGARPGLVVDDHQLVAPPVDAVRPGPPPRSRRPATDTHCSSPTASTSRRALGVLGQPAAGPLAVEVRPARRRGSPRCSSAGPPAGPPPSGVRRAGGSAKSDRSARCTTAPNVLAARAPHRDGSGPVEVGEPVAAGAVVPGAEPGRGDAHQPGGIEVEPELRAGHAPHGSGVIRSSTSTPDVRATSSASNSVGVGVLDRDRRGLVRAVVVARPGGDEAVRGGELAQELAVLRRRGRGGPPRRRRGRRSARSAITDGSTTRPRRRASGCANTATPAGGPHHRDRPLDGRVGLGHVVGAAVVQQRGERLVHRLDHPGRDQRPGQVRPSGAGAFGDELEHRLDVHGVAVGGHLLRHAAPAGRRVRRAAATARPRSPGVRGRTGTRAGAPTPDAPRGRSGSRTRTRRRAPAACPPAARRRPRPTRRWCRGR